MLLINEMALYVCTCLTCVFTDFTYIDVQRYDVGPVWISIVLITFTFDVGVLIFVIGYRSKLLAENWIERCRRDKIRAELISQGRLKVVVPMTHYQKEVHTYKLKQARMLRK